MSSSPNPYLDDSKVYIGESKTCGGFGGFGVFAKVPLVQGELVELGIMVPLKNVDGNENPHLFTWSDDRKVWALGSGHLPFYNHSDTPNCEKVGNLTKDTMEVRALCAIPAGEELTNMYFSKEWRSCFQSF